MHLFVCHGTDTRDRGKHTLLSSPRSWSSSVTSSRRGSDSVLPFGESGAKRRYLGREPLLTFWNGRDSRSGGEENKKNGRPGLARINAKTRIDRETRRERVHDSQEGRLGARASLGGTKEEEGERKGKKRRRRASVAAFGSKRNSEGVFRGGEDWLPRDHGPVVGVQRAPRDQEGYGQKGPSRSGETKRGERGRGKEGNIAAAAAAAAVAVSAPLRVTLEGAHRRTVAQATGAPVALKFSFFPLAERGIPRNIGGERQRSIERGEKTFQKWIIRRGVSFWEGSFCSVFVGTNPTRCLSDQR